MDYTLKYILSQCAFYFRYIIYELYYYVIGGQAMFEDIIYKYRNKCEYVDKRGEYAIVTGGARGIGATLVKKLLKCNMDVIIGCRNVNAGQKVVNEYRKNGITSGVAHVLELDLESFDSIKTFVANVSKISKNINVLVNNAGIMFPPFRETKEGFESQWAVNYLGPYLLTHLLYPLLENAAKSNKNHSRIVNVSSCAHLAASPINLDKINRKNSYLASEVYAQSKLAQVLFTIELNRRLKLKGSKINVLCVHPGIVNTELFDGTPLKIFFPWVLKYICKDVDAGATTVLYPCVSPRLKGKGGLYLSNCGTKKPSRLALNKKVQKQLFEHTLKTLNISEFGLVNNH